MTAQILEFKRPPTQEEIIERIKAVKQTLTFQERMERVKHSVERVNQLMEELRGPKKE